METDENEEKLLRSVALQNANTILLARQQAEVELRALKDRLAADLQAMTHLHHVGSYCVQPGQDFDECLGKIVEAAIAVTGANKGNMQLLDASSGALKLVAHRGFEEPSLNFFAMVRDEAAACGATQRSERVVVEDITQSRIFAGTPALDVLFDAGVRAVQSTPLLSSAGHLLGMISTYFGEPRHMSERELRLMDLLARQAADFVERKGAEEALRQSEEQFRSVFNQTTGGIAQTDLTGRFVLVNDRYCQIVGRSREELLKLRMHDITHPEDLPSSAEQFRALTEGGPNFVIEKRYLRPDGSAVRVHNDVAAVRDAEGNVRYIAAAVADITERKQAEEARARLAAIVESSDDAIIGKDLNGVITSWNKGAERLFGYTAQEAIGKPVTLLIPPDRLHEEPAILERLKRGERVEHFETIRLRKDGTALDISLTISPVRDATGRIVGASKVARDITERKQAEEALKDADRRKDEFLATLAHELRNPLAPIRNSLHILRRAGRDAYSLERVHEMMERQVNHMVRLVDDLMEVSRITRGSVEIRKESVELTAVLQSAIETARPLIELRRHKLAVCLPPEPVILDADPIRLAQVFANILNNAAKYTPENGQIWIYGERASGIVVVSIRDSGAGITEDMLPRIFEMFTRADEASQPGLGIGLTLARRLLEMQGGTLEAKSSGLGKGSEFIVRLPVRMGEGAPREKASLGHPSTFRIPQRVLVVDDNHDAADSLGMLLRFEGADVQVVYDGASALRALETYQPKIVLVDLGMPGMDGFEVARKVRENPEFKDLMIVALTGWGQEQDRARSREAGFAHHLIKPVDLNALQALLASAEKTAA